VSRNEPAPRAHAGDATGAATAAGAYAGATGGHENLARVRVPDRHGNRPILSEMAGPNHRGAGRILLVRRLAEPYACAS